MSNTIRRQGRAAGADAAFTLDEANALVAQARANGVVSNSEKKVIRELIAQFKDAFQPGALEALHGLLEVQQPTPFPPVPTVISLPTATEDRPVVLTPTGVFSASLDGALPKTLPERGEALFRAAEAVDNARTPLLANLSLDLRRQTFEQLRATLSQVAAGQPLPPELAPSQALQLRASSAAVLLDLIESSAEPELKAELLTAYTTLARAETDPRLRESLAFHLSNAASTKTGPAKAIADALLREVAPLTPPYEKWFANGNTTVDLSWTVGSGGEFWKGFTNYLKKNGFKAVGPENQYGVTTYEGTFNKPGVGETTFRISVREGGPNVLAPMSDAKVDVVGYDGHSDWGRNMSKSVRSGPSGSGDGKLIFYNLCAGKGILDRVKEKYPEAQLATTYAASSFWVDREGKMTEGEGGFALMAMLHGIANRADWQKIHADMNRSATIGTRTWDNYLTPVSTLVRERVLDRDNDGQADYLDKHFNYSTFTVREDTAREFSAVKQDRPAAVLDGTKVLVSAAIVNVLSEFSGILDLPNPDSKVVAGGWYEPKLTDPKDIFRFTEQRGADNKPEYVMAVSARYAHMSEDAMRATASYEFTTFLQRNQRLGLSPADAKLAGVLAFVQSLDVDEGLRDSAVFETFKARYNLPAALTLAGVKQALQSHTGHNYAGDMKVLLELKKALGPEAVAQFARPEVGQLVSVVS